FFFDLPRARVIRFPPAPRNRFRTCCGSAGRGSPPEGKGRDGKTSCAGGTCRLRLPLKLRYVRKEEIFGSPLLKNIRVFPKKPDCGSGRRSCSTTAAWAIAHGCRKHPIRSASSLGTAGS